MADMEDHDEYKSKMREELSHLPLGKLKAMQDKLGLKVFNKIKTGSKTKSSINTKFKRLYKNRPAEFSARKPVPKETETVKQKVRRDPRFDDLSGDFDPDIFKTSYSFLDEMKAKEKSELRKQIEETQDKAKKSQLKKIYNRMEQKEKAEKRQEEQRRMEKEWKKAELEKVEEGKTPYFLKKSEKKARFEAKYQKELEESGKLEKHTERKNKKLAGLEKKRQKWKMDAL